MPGSPGIGVILAPETNFINNHLIVWWQQTLTQSFSPPKEMGDDWGMPWNSAVGAIEGGQVVYAGLPPDSQVPGHTSLGYVVQIKNADGSILHYQHLTSLAGIGQGDIIAPGQTIGYSGGCAAGSTPGNCITDSWSSGPHIEVRYSPTYNASAGIWGQNWQDPIPYYQKLGASFKPGTVGQNTVGTAYGPTGTPSAQFTSGNCAPWDIGCLIQNAWGPVGTVLVRIGLFVLALVFVILGGLILIHPDPASILGNVPGVKGVQSL